MADDNLGFYDLIIDIESFDDLKSSNGWKILTSDDGNDKYHHFISKDNKSESESKLLNRIGVLGDSSVGKTFILKKLIGKQGDIKATKGISVIYPEKTEKDKLFVCLDSQGSEVPIIDEKLSAEEIFNLSEEERLKKVKDLSKDKKFTEIFIQDFIINKSNILIVVVDQLTFSEQKLINRLKSKENFDKLFVIHNLQFFGNKNIIEEYIENIIKKSIFSNLEKAYIKNLDQKSNENDSNLNEKAYYYTEKEFGSIDNNENTKQNQQQVIHLFMAKEGSDAGKFFNDTTINFLRKQIMSQTKTETFDVLEEIKKFLSFASLNYMIKEEKKEDKKERPIDKDEIEIKTENDVTYLQSKNKNFQLKDCIINEMGISNFTSENSINPSFICYKGTYVNKTKNEEWPALIVKAEMFVDRKDIKPKIYISEDYETMNITISCEKKLEENKDIIEEFEGGDIKKGEMRINIQFKLKDFKIEDKKVPPIREPFPGIKLIYFKLEDKNNKNEVAKTEIINEKNNSRTKK